MTELKPCPLPWCGSSDVKVVTEYESGSRPLRLASYVVCHHCGCQGPTKDTQEKATQAWNTRPEMPAEKALRELVRVIKGLDSMLIGDGREQDLFWGTVDEAKEALGDE